MVEAIISEGPLPRSNSNLSGDSFFSELSVSELVENCIVVLLMGEHNLEIVVPSDFKQARSVDENG
jgi:hypothetical protein